MIAELQLFAGQFGEGEPLGRRAVADFDGHGNGKGRPRHPIIHCREMPRLSVFANAVLLFEKDQWAGSEGQAGEPAQMGEEG